MRDLSKIDSLLNLDMMDARFRIAIVTNMPAPYVVPIHQRVAQTLGVSLHVIYCSQREPNRLWDLPPLDFDHTFLRERFFMVGGSGVHNNLDVALGERCIHNNLDVISSLKQFSPDVVVTVGFNPTYLYAFGYALFNGIAHVPMTDGTFASEQRLSVMHRIARRFVYGKSNAFASASLGGKKIYESYGIGAERCFQSCLCIDNTAFSPDLMREKKKFDFIFCGRIEQGKNPHFALNVAIDTAKKIHRKVKILFVGAGSQEESVKKSAALQSDLVEAEFNGFAAQHDLPSLYRSARIFLFPTVFDVWGVVANEACAAGLPILISPHAGAAGELVLDGENGFVCDLDVSLWAERATLLLTKQDVYQKFSDRSLALVSKYTFDSAASGLVEACRFALSAGSPQNKKRILHQQLRRQVD